MEILIFIALGLFLLIILFEFFRQRMTRNITNSIHQTSESLKGICLIKPDTKVYQEWMNPSPEELYNRIMTHSIGNKETRARLIAKLYQRCVAINEVLEHDNMVGLLINSGQLKTKLFSNDEDDGIYAEDLADKRSIFISIIDQSLLDIKKEIE